MKIFPNCKEKGSFPKSKIKSLVSIAWTKRFKVGLHIVRVILREEALKKSRRTKVTMKMVAA